MDGETYMGQAVPVGEVRNGFKILVLTYKDVRVDGRIILRWIIEREAQVGQWWAFVNRKFVDDLVTVRFSTNFVHCSHRILLLLLLLFIIIIIIIIIIITFLCCINIYWTSFMNLVGYFSGQEIVLCWDDTFFNLRDGPKHASEEGGEVWISTEDVAGHKQTIQADEAVNKNWTQYRILYLNPLRTMLKENDIK